MKSEHRHQLETNALAKRLDVAIERFRPYASTVAGVVLAIVVVMFLWSYFAGSSSARQSQAWDEFNRSVSGPAPNLEQLRLAAQDHPGTKMQEIADVTWADGQVWTAARDYIYNRPAAMEALTRATSAYEGVLETSDDERLVNRAQLGLARIHEMQGKLEEAREAYLKVKGAYTEYAKQQADRLADPETKETYAWLATARPPMPKAPAGPGTPGRRPEFSAGELALPGAAPTDGTAPDGTPAESDSFENLLQGLDLGTSPADSPDRYAPGEAPPAADSPQSASQTENPTTVETGSGETPANDAETAEKPAQ